MLRILVFACLLFNVSLAFAEEDPWYETAPSCVIPGADPQRTHQYKESIDLRNATVKWQIKTNTSLPPVCSGNLIITAGPNGFDVSTGKKLWGYDDQPYADYVDHQVYKNRLYTLVSYGDHDSKDYFSALSIYNLLDGRLIKSMRIHGTQRSLLVYNDRVYVGGTGLSCYNINSFQKEWEISQDGLGLATNGDSLFFSSGKNFCSINLKTGQLNWCIHPDGSLALLGVVALDSSAIFSVGSFFIYRIDQKTGKIIWKQQVYKDSISGYPKINSDYKKIYINTIHSDLQVFDYDGDSNFLKADENFRGILLLSGKDVFIKNGSQICSFDAATLHKNYCSQSLNSTFIDFAPDVSYKKYLLGRTATGLALIAP